MTDNKDKNSKLNPKDQKIWDEYVTDMKPIKHADVIAEDNFADLLDNHTCDEAEIIKADTEEKKEVEEEKTVANIAKKSTSPRSQEIDKNTYARLKKGQIPIEARLDLHGFNKGQAREALINFLTRAHAIEQRCVIVITGKGRQSNKTGDKIKSVTDNWLTPSKGILKSQLPVWLDEQPCRDIVLNHVHAIPKDGGSGAFYIYLRKKR